MLRRLLPWFPLLLLGSDADTRVLLKRVEEHYNRVQTLQVNFQETYTVQKRRRMESGVLLLRKPGKMRWNYAQPAGKLFVSDGKSVFLYNPAEQRVDKMRLKDSEDMRAPLAFLLGKLDFQKEFQSFQVRPEAGGQFVIQALPKGDQLPYRQVEFLISADGTIRRLVVTGQDESLLQFDLTGEEMNVPLTESLFRFVPPAGATVVDTTKGPEGQP